jgi:hypothetical protein
MKYTKELLEEILKGGGVTVLEEYSRWNQRMRVRFRCECGVETSKRFEMLNVHRLPYCDKCSLKKKEQRRQKTNIDKYGVTNAVAHPDIIQKIKHTNAIKFGGHPKRTTEVQEKWVATCLEKYGGHPNQNREVQTKSEFKGYHYKNYTFPSGKVVKVQGYEPLALEQLIQKCVKEEDIVVGKANVPTGYMIRNMYISQISIYHVNIS